MLVKLKTECGYQFTSKLESMFTDIKTSRDTMQEYKARRQASSNGEDDVELSVQVCDFTCFRCLVMGLTLGSRACHPAECRCELSQSVYCMFAAVAARGLPSGLLQWWRQHQATCSDMHVCLSTGAMSLWAHQWFTGCPGMEKCCLFAHPAYQSVQQQQGEYKVCRHASSNGENDIGLCVQACPTAACSDVR